MISFRRTFAKVAIVGCAISGLAWQACAASPEGMKLYIFTSQPLDIAKSALSSAATGDEKIVIPVAFFLIKHPKGNIMFDTGDNDKVITDQTYWGPMAAMLDKGVSADLAIDVQLDEIINAFWPPKAYAGPYISGDFEMLRAPTGSGSTGRQPTIELNGDLDLFGDGSVFVHRAAGHTPGSQLAVVRLPKTGTVILTSDACYLPENLAKDILPSIGLTYDPTAMLNGYAYIKRIRDTEKGDVLMAHDAEGFKAHKHSPEFYE